MEVHPHEPLKQARTLINSLTLTWDALLDRNAKFLLILTYKKREPAHSSLRSFNTLVGSGR
jgi:hypothetical protein